MNTKTGLNRTGNLSRLQGEQRVFKCLVVHSSPCVPKITAFARRHGIYRILAGQVRERLTGFQALLNGSEGVAGVGSSFYQNVGGPALFPGKLFSTRLILLAYFFFRNLKIGRASC